MNEGNYGNLKNRQNGGWESHSKTILIACECEHRLAFFMTDEQKIV